MENFTKNAIDVMEGACCIDITTGTADKKVWIAVSDRGFIGVNFLI